MKLSLLVSVIMLSSLATISKADLIDRTQMSSASGFQFRLDQSLIFYPGEDSKDALGTNYTLKVIEDFISVDSNKHITHECTAVADVSSRKTRVVPKGTILTLVATKKFTTLRSAQLLVRGYRGGYNDLYSIDDRSFFRLRMIYKNADGKKEKFLIECTQDVVFRFLHGDDLPALPRIPFSYGITMSLRDFLTTNMSFLTLTATPEGPVTSEN